MTLDDAADRVFDLHKVEWTAETEDGGADVRAAVGIELREEPHALLRE